MTVTCPEWVVQVQQAINCFSSEILKYKSIVTSVAASKQIGPPTEKDEEIEKSSSFFAMFFTNGCHKN